MGSASWPEILALLWAIPSLLLYILILIFLIKNRENVPFSNHFFKLLVSVGFADVLNAFNIYLFRMSRVWGWINWRAILCHPNLVISTVSRVAINSATYLFGWIAYLSVLVIAANRYCCFVYPGFWKSRVQSAAIVGQWLIPCFITAPRLGMDTNVIINNSSDGGTWISIKHESSTYKLIYEVTFGIITPLVVNVAVGVLYWKMYAHVRALKRDFGLGNQDRSELRLASMGMCLFILMVIVELSVVSYTTNSRILKSPWLTDVTYRMIGTSIIFFSLSNPFLILIHSKTTRQNFYAWLIGANVPPSNSVHAND